MMKNRSFQRTVFAVQFATLLVLSDTQAAEKNTWPVVTDKTMVVWVAPDNLTQRGGSALTLDDLQGHFDGIIFGERAPRKWMAGSNNFSRTDKDQSAYPAETADPKTLVQVAMVYRGKEVALYRNAEQFARYEIGQPQSFGSGSVVVLGLRHLQSTDHACFAGAIEDARIYSGALTREQIAALKPDQPSSPEPLVWWTFAEGAANDRMGRLTETVLEGNARLVDGRLQLDGKGSFMVALPTGTTLGSLARPTVSTDSRVTASREHRTRLQTDRQRPAYHFVTPEGRCMPFDPNGAIFWKGLYHLCYIYQDERGHCWGHASSRDLVHWRFHPPALAPNPGDPDRGIFSGNAFVNKQGEAVLLYHGVGAGNCIATSNEDELVHWKKLPSNPIVPIPKTGDPHFGKYRSWDPHGWLEGDTYYAIFGGNPATLFKSKDLVRWDFIDRFLTNDLPGVEPDEDISCPDFFKLGNKYMLLCISHKRGCRYYLGRFENEKFHPETHARMNWPGGTCFAPESLLDDRGRRIMWAWALDRRADAQVRESGWSGTMTLPRVLSLGADGTLRITPVPELESLRMNHQRQEGLGVAKDSELVVKGVSGDCMELALTIDPRNSQECGVKVRCSPDGAEQTVISFDPAKKVLRIDVAKSTLDAGIVHRTFCMYGGDNPAVTRQEAPFTLAAGEPLRLRIFVDHSILEVFANDRQCLTQRIYPTREDSSGVRLFSRGGEMQVGSLESWKMAAANLW